VSVSGDICTRKTLTVIVPAYNSASTLEKCLDSLYGEKVQDDVEILIINDGSTDETESIARKYERKHPSYYVISKENGGHGSTINIASKLANGKYLKVVDSDDWVVNFVEYVELLRNATADVVFTHFYTVGVDDENIREYRMNAIPFGIECSFENFWRNKKNVQEVCNFHGITYRTEFYNSTNVHLSEKISYEDQEYATLPFAKVNTVLPLDMHLYRYRIGNPNQSMSNTQQVKNIDQMEAVLCKVIDLTPDNISSIVKDYFMFKKSAMMLSYYMAVLIKNPNKKSGRKLVKDLDCKIRSLDSDLYDATRRKYRVCYILSYFGFADALKRKLQQYRLCKSIVHLLKWG